MLFKYQKKNTKNKVSNISVTISSSTEKSKHMQIVFWVLKYCSNSHQNLKLSLLGSVDYDDSKLETEFACLLIFWVFGLDIITLFLK